MGEADVSQINTKINAWLFKKKSMVSNYSKRFEKEVHSCIKPYNKESDV